MTVLTPMCATEHLLNWTSYTDTLHVTLRSSSKRKCQHENTQNLFQPIRKFTEKLHHLCYSFSSKGNAIKESWWPRVDWRRCQICCVGGSMIALPLELSFDFHVCSSAVPNIKNTNAKYKKRFFLISTNDSPPSEMTAAETRINRFHPSKLWSLQPAIMNARVGTTNPAQFPPEFTIDYPLGCPDHAL